MASNFPHIILTGGPRERGRQHGEAAGKQIRVSLDLYAKLFNVYAALSWEDAKKKALRFEDSIAKYLPDALEEMQGIAEGCGLGYGDILALNCRSELMVCPARRLQHARAAAGTGQRQNYPGPDLGLADRVPPRNGYSGNSPGTSSDHPHGFRSGYGRRQGHQFQRAGRLPQCAQRGAGADRHTPAHSLSRHSQFQIHQQCPEQADVAQARRNRALSPSAAPPGWS